MLIAAVVSPRCAPRANAGLQCNRAVITRTTGNVTPDDAVTTFDGVTEDIGPLAGDIFDVTAGFVAGDDWQ